MFCVRGQYFGASKSQRYAEIISFVPFHKSIQIDGMRSIHRLLLWHYSIAPDFVLNSGPEPDSDLAVSSLAADLYRLSNLMKVEAYDSKSGKVNYAQLSTSSTYIEYRKCACHLQAFDPIILTYRKEQLAFWINLYNALIMDAVIQFDVKDSVTEVPGFFWRVAYLIGGQRYCAFDIEYGILRANASHPAIPGAHFGARDPRRQYSLLHLDPRVHFALVCAARSCPPISVYHAEQIDPQLDLATEAYINGGGALIDRSRSEVLFSRIFQWYAPDFGGRLFGLGSKYPLLEFIARYLSDISDREFILHSKVNVRFQPYDWTLNN